MLERLIESRPRNGRPGTSVGSTVGAVMLHTVIIWVGVIATTRAPVRSYIPIDVVDTLVPWTPDVEDRRDPSPQLPLLRPLVSPVQALSTLPMLSTIPDGIAPIEPNGRLDPLDYLGRGIEGHGTAARSTSAGDRAGVFAPLAVDETPRRLSCPPALYPGMLRRAGIDGWVTLQFVIDRTGRVERQSIAVTGSSNEGFEPPARDMVWHCRFRPGRVGVDSVRVLVQMDVMFSLRR